MLRTFTILLMVCVALFVVLSCKDDDDDSSGETNTPDDDAADDDDAGEVDFIIDADFDNSPRIIDAYWEPNPTELGGLCADNEWCSVLVMHLCDPDNDLLPNGSLWYEPGFPEPMVELDRLYVFPGFSLGDAAKCYQPQKVGLPVVFGYAGYPSDVGDYCIDIEVADSAGNFSEKIEDLCVTHQGDGSRRAD